MTSYLIGRNHAELRERAAEVSKIVSGLAGMTPDEVLDNRKDAWFVGTPEQIAERMRDVAAMGVDLFMLQHFLLDASDALKLLPSTPLPPLPQTPQHLRLRPPSPPP